MKQQIVWIELSDEPKFSLAENIVSANTVFFLTGERIPHILGMLNSKLITWYFRHCVGTTSGVGTNRWLKYTIEQIPLPPPSAAVERMALEISDDYDKEKDWALDREVCQCYGLTGEEASYIIGVH